jgi:hypothetical protein
MRRDGVEEVKTRDVSGRYSTLLSHKSDPGGSLVRALRASAGGLRVRQADGTPKLAEYRQIANLIKVNKANTL